ncbi:hypothetical protein TESG_04570 [Trichophyton tonsurans CBS 112818]|uniref:Uncharacterized protein n=1 Tax=Trichophyton tonsurans (strain CBS 112818) TaxID=647933 RepID=F2S0Q7_TRIT1|nr:hypothetical protein TESG_04570 [Trichophyton tonsurans CBS 112818]
MSSSNKLIQLPALPAGNNDSKAGWPVWKIEYRAEGITKVLRIEWHHRPDHGEMMETLRVIFQYITNPCDIILVGTEGGFKNVKPEYCIVFADAHPTRESQTDRSPDKDLHISLRFSSAGDRARRMGYSVHVHVDPGTRNHLRQQTKWGHPTPDIPKMRAVYEGRTEWPEGADSSDCRWAPGHEPRPPPTTAGFVDAPIPKTNPWAK